MDLANIDISLQKLRFKHKQFFNSLSLQKQKLCEGEKYMTKEVNREVQLTPRSPAILDYVQKSLENEKSKLNTVGGNNEKECFLFPGSEVVAQATYENDVSMDIEMVINQSHFIQ